MREKIEELVIWAIRSAMDKGELVLSQMPEPAVERPRDLAHGDWATSVALRCAKEAHRNPREIAQSIAGYIASSELVDAVEVAGPGFINMHLSNTALQSVLVDVRSQGADFGRCDIGHGMKVQVEFVSANPTGPMHVGHGRWAALGDSMSNVLEHAGYDVEREFYINDFGNQMNIFAASVSTRYLQICRLSADLGIPFPDAAEKIVADTALPPEERVFSAEMGENSYGGAYIVDIAREIIEDEGTVWIDASEAEREAHFKERSYRQVLEHEKAVLHRAGVDFDVWFSERTLHEPGADGKSAIDRAIDTLRDEGYIYQKDGATWFRSTDFGDDKDRVLLKADGDTTYFAADVAYHQNKFERGYERVIDIWGADHHGYIARVQAACKALGYEGRLEVVIGQLVNLLRDGVPVRLSKRNGTMVTFEELIDEVGRDATRYLMVAKSTDQAIDFDIEAAKKQDSSNPVYYVQYAHARICSILRKAAEMKDVAEPSDAASMKSLAEELIGEDPDLSLLADESELALMRKISEFPEVVEGSARDLAPFRLTHYAEELASTFHQFYTRCHVITDDVELTRARLVEVEASRITLATVLGLLGVSAPLSM